MPHTLPAPLWSNPDARRCKSALAAELTPLSLDKEAGNASFAGSKEIYWTDLSQCTCLSHKPGQVIPLQAHDQIGNGIKANTI